jgi:tetratricopeptide (TPR) repeat protein
MAITSNLLRSLLVPLVLTSFPDIASAEPELARIVFQNGTSIPINAVVLQGDKLAVVAESDGFAPGQSFPVATADHIFGQRPTELYAAVALLVTEKPKDALKLLEPIMTAHQATAKIPGNFWVETAGVAVVAYALSGNVAKCTEVGKSISDATPAQGVDPIVFLGKALSLPASTPLDVRLAALADLTISTQPSDVSAYAFYFRGLLQQEAKRVQDALDSYLSVTCLVPSGELIVNAAAEIKAADILAGLGRREEAVALFTSAQRSSLGTVLAEQAKTRLETLK